MKREEKLQAMMDEMVKEAHELLHSYAEDAKQWQGPVKRPGDHERLTNWARLLAAGLLAHVSQDETEAALEATLAILGCAYHLGRAAAACEKPIVPEEKAR